MKRRRLLLLTFAVAMLSVFTLNTYAQFGNTKTVSVLNNDELIRAVENPNVKIILPKAGYYAFLGKEVADGDKVIKGESLQRASCVYILSTFTFCANTVPSLLAQTNGDVTCAIDGHWTYSYNGGTSGFPGSAVFDDDTDPNTSVTVSHPGTYIFRYTWYDKPYYIAPGVPDPTAIPIAYVEGDHFAVETPGIEVSSVPTLCEGDCFNFEVTVTRNRALPPLSQARPPYVFDYSVNGGLPTVFSLVSTDETVPGVSGIYKKDVYAVDQCDWDCGDYSFTFNYLSAQPITCGVTSFVREFEIYDTPVITIQGDDDVCLDDLPYELDASYTVDCPYPGAAAWTLVSGPGTVDLVGNVINGVSVCGAYVFQYAVTNGPCDASETVTINFFDVPAITIQPDAEVCLEDLPYNLTASYTVACDYPAVAVWTLVSGPGTVDLVGNAVNAVSICGAYTFQYEVTNGPCSSSSSVTITFYDKPLVWVQADDEICGSEYELQSSYYVQCPHPTLFSAGWSKVSGPGNALISGNVVTVDACGEYEFAYTVNNGFAACETVSTVTINFYDKPVITMQADDEICGLTYDLTVSYTVGCAHPDLTAEWSLVSGPGTADFVGDNVTVSVCGEYEFAYTVDNGFQPCTSVSTVTINFYDKPVVYMQADDEICGDTYTLAASYYVACMHPNFLAGWSLVSGPGSASFVGNVVTVDACGEYEFAYTVNNGFAACETVSTVTINFYDSPVVDAGPDDEVCGLEYTLTPSYTVNCPDPGLTAVWSGPTGVTFVGNVVTVPACGEYIFAYTVTNNSCPPVVDYVTIKFFDTPVVDAGDDDEVCGLTYMLDPSFTVDCDYPAVAEWTGPAGVIFNGNEVTVPACGEYEFAYTVTNGPCGPVTDFVTIKFYDIPVPEAGPDQEICGLSATLAGSYTVDCPHPGITAYWGYKTPAPGTVTFDDPYDPNTGVTVSACGEYTFVYTVENGPCGTVTDFVKINFYDEADITVDAPEEVCGYETTVYVAYTVDCPAATTDKSFSYVGPGTAIITDGVDPDTYNIVVDLCGEYIFTYTVVNGPCTTSTDFSITFYESPKPRIVGPATTLCLETDYTVVDDRTCLLGTVEYSWTIVGGYFVPSGLTTATGDAVTAIWTERCGTLSVFATLLEVDDCFGEDIDDICPDMPLLEGQIKYWNEFETYMPTPYPTFDYATYPHDYFYVELWNGNNFLEVVAAQPRLKEDLIELISHFEFDIDAYFDDYGCDGYWLKVWDGGLYYHYAFPGGSGVPPVSGTHLGANYTYKNWGGGNATDALIVTQMASGLAVNPPVLGVGSIASTPIYGYYSHSVADVNSSNRYVNGGITALDALTINYRALGLIGMFPNNRPGGGVQYSPNFMVTGRMVTTLPEMTWPLPFDYQFDAAGNPVAVLPSNPDDVPFFHSNHSYLYFTSALDHKYSSRPLTLSSKQKINIYYQALGDINSSFVPPSYPFPYYPKADETITLAYVGEQVVSKGEIVTVPIRINRNAELGAITLDLTYNTSLIEVVGVNHGEDFVNIDAETGTLRINWWNLQGANFAAGEAIALVEVRVLADISADARFFELANNTELADRNAQTIKNITLETTALSTVSGDLFITNYPNPFRTTTNISYSLPEAGNVSLVVYNKLGQIVETLVSTRQEAGTYQVEFGRTDLTPGVYFYKIVVEGESNTHTSTNSMIFMK